MTSLHERIAAITSPAAAEEIIDILNEESLTPCRDRDCIRLLPHSRIARHLWRHEVGAPRTRGLFGWRCFNCGQSSWRRIHRASRP